MSRNTKRESEGPVPMDPAAREGSAMDQIVNRQRPCYAIKTLIAEVLDLFPETSAGISGFDGRNVALNVTFDVAPCPELVGLLSLIESDARVALVLHDIEEEAVLVQFHSRATTQDLRDPFGLADAWEVMSEENESW